MTKTGTQIRLYIEDEATRTVEPICPTLLDNLCQTFLATTGWELRHFESGQTVPQVNSWSQQLCGPDREKPGTLAILKPEADDTNKMVQVEVASAMASNIAALLDELYQTRTQLWQREAHLASAIPLVVRPEDEDRQLAQRLEAVLKCAADSVQCTSAALYVLDDDTRYLKLRAHSGLSDERFLDPPRRLRGSKGDLEALTGHAVVLESAERCEVWETPFPGETAICVPVATANVPLGTLWVFGDIARSFGDAEINLVEVVAGRIAVELEREILLREQALTLRNRDSMDAAESQAHQWCNALPKIDNWSFGAAASQDSGLHGDSLTSYIHEDGRIGIALGSAETTGVCSALSASSFSAAAQSHRALLSPSRRLERINETISTISAGDQQLSACTALLNPQDGRLQLSLAGTVRAFAIRPHGWEQLQVEESAEFIGANFDSKYRNIKSTLDPSDVLLVLAGRERDASSPSSVQRVDAAHLAEALLHHHHLSVMQMIDYVAALVTREASTWYDRPAVLLIRRED